jgi:hypothetical protein
MNSCKCCILAKLQHLSLSSFNIVPHKQSIYPHCERPNRNAISLSGGKVSLHGMDVLAVQILPMVIREGEA